MVSEKEFAHALKACAVLAPVKPTSGMSWSGVCIGGVDPPTPHVLRMVSGRATLLVLGVK